MAVSYDKLWKILIDKKFKKTDLIKNAKIAKGSGIVRVIFICSMPICSIILNISS